MNTLFNNTFKTTLNKICYGFGFGIGMASAFNIIPRNRQSINNGFYTDSNSSLNNNSNNSNNSNNQINKQIINKLDKLEEELNKIILFK